MTYNGYKNYETWNVALHIANDRLTYCYWQSRASGIKAAVQNAEVGDSTQLKDGTWTAEQAARFLLADVIKAAIRDTSPLINDATMYSDLMNHALGQVDWDEVAGSILEE